MLSQERYDLLTAIGMEWGNTAEKRISDSYKVGFQHLEVLRYRYRSKGVPSEIIEKLKAMGFHCYTSL